MVRASGICLEGPGFNPQSGHLFCLTEHLHTLISMENLANTYQNQGRWKEAEQLEVQAMNMRTKLLGPNHPDTLKCMQTLTRFRTGKTRQHKLDIRSWLRSLYHLSVCHAFQWILSISLSSRKNTNFRSQQIPVCSGLMYNSIDNWALASHWQIVHQ